MHTLTPISKEFGWGKKGISLRVVCKLKLPNCLITINQNKPQFCHFSQIFRFQVSHKFSQPPPIIKARRVHLLTRLNQTINTMMKLNWCHRSLNNKSPLCRAQNKQQMLRPAPIKPAKISRCPRSSHCNEGLSKSHCCRHLKRLFCALLKDFD